MSVHFPFIRRGLMKYNGSAHGRACHDRKQSECTAQLLELREQIHVIIGDNDIEANARTQAFKGIYDRYTQYRRDHAILGECLPYNQFMKQLRKSDLYLETKNVRIGDDQRKAVVLNYPILHERCDIDGFLHTQIEPLTSLPKY